MIRTMLGGVVALLVLAGGVHAQTPMTESTEQLQLKPRRVPGLLGYGYDLGEYRGETSTRSSSFRAFGTAISRDTARTKFTVESPNISPGLQAECAGGQKRTQLGWISFEREDLSYVCTFARDCSVRSDRCHVD